LECNIIGYMLSPVRLSSVCRSSVCNARAPYSGTAFGTLAICWHPHKILWRSSQGNPSVGGVKHNRSSKI